ncbi:MAG: T9SS type A sorting domain-containing protein [Bacteroidota bacterium]
MKNLKQIIALSFFAICFYQLSATNYYIKNGGNDSNGGISDATAWSSINKIMSHPFNPGDTIFFKKGSVWTGTNLHISRSGASGNPIVFTTYGNGTKPTIKNPGAGQWTNCIQLFADWIIVDGFIADGADYSGVYIGSGSDNNVIRNCDAKNVGLGFELSGQYNLITHCSAGQLKMIVNTPGGNNDDYGAMGVLVTNSFNEVSYSRFDSCYAPSYDFFEDGGAIEFYGNVSSCYIHHNWSYNSEGFFEVGGSSSNQCKNNVIAYNVFVSTRNQKIMWLHVSGGFGILLENLRIENNTFVATGPGPMPSPTAIGSTGTLSSTSVVLRNNIIYTENWSYIITEPAIVHDHNLFYKTNGSTNIGIPLGTGEVVADPLFMNMNAKDLHLQSSSPAINAGTNLGYTSDFENNPVGSMPDMGAYEFNLSTDINGEYESDDVIIYPNPFSDHATIYLPDLTPSGSSFLLYDLSGKKIMYKKNIDKEFLITNEGHTNGIYFYQIMNENNIIATGKLIINN